MVDSPRLDPAALTRLDKLGGPGFARRIIGIFLTEGPRPPDTPRLRAV